MIENGTLKDRLFEAFVGNGSAFDLFARTFQQHSLLLASMKPLQWHQDHQAKQSIIRNSTFTQPLDNIAMHHLALSCFREQTTFMEELRVVDSCLSILEKQAILLSVGNRQQQNLQISPATAYPKDDRRNIAIQHLTHQDLFATQRKPNTPVSSPTSSYRNPRDPTRIPDIDPIPLLTDPPLRNTPPATQPTHHPKESPRLRSLPRLPHTIDTNASTKPLQKQYCNPASEITNSHTSSHACPQWSNTITMSLSPALILMVST